MSNTILKNLNFSVNLEKLKEYYEILQQQYNDKKWNWEDHGKDIKQEWQDRVNNTPGGDLTYGWGIQSNLEDLNIPCPPYNVSIHKTTDYRNTEMAFGVLTKLQEIFPYGYRWSIAVQPPGGMIAKHSDYPDEDTIHIPIMSNDGAFFIFEVDGSEIPIHMPANGQGYLLHTEHLHYTINHGKTDRVHLVFRAKKINIDKILNVSGELF